MSKYVVAISIDKVQTFLYYVLNAPVQDKQTNSDTLSTIIQSSRMISEQLSEDIGISGHAKGAFGNQIDEQLLTSSGNCFFVTSLSEAEIIEKVKNLFKNYYHKYNGQLLMKYTYFPLEILEQSKPHSSSSSYKLLAIKESKRRLRSDTCLSQIIEQNKEVLFAFEQSVELPPVQSSSKYPAFTRTINNLFDDREADNDNHFRIAVIKGDLDGMGDLFKSIKDYELYDAVSKILSKYISLDYLHQITADMQRKDTEKQRIPLRLYPLYMAGDDVFFAVPVHQLDAGINICKRILKRLNEEIKKASERLGKGDTSIPLSMSIGVDFTFNREPIRYYYERVQQQLDVAKAEKGGPMATKNMRPADHCMKISINNFVLHDYEDTDKVLELANENNANLLTWRSMMNGVERLKQAMSHDFAAHHFLYGLLEKITDQNIYNNELKYSNALFYHLIPQHLESENQPLRDAELWLLEAIIGQIMNRKNSGKNKKGELRFAKKILLDEWRKKRLEGYIRILLLFSDPRFNRTTQSLKGFNPAQVKSDLFNKPLRYIYDTSLDNPSVWPLRKVFIEPGEYTLESDKTKVEVYRTLRISNSLFHKIKRKYLYQPRVAAELIAAANPQTEDDVTKRMNQSKQEHKAPPGLFFKKETFLEKARNPRIWTSDYVDALMIFYKLKEKSIQLREMFDFKASNSSPNHRQNRNYPGGKKHGSRKKSFSNKR